MTELPESRRKLHSFCLLAVPHGCSSVQSVFLAQKCGVAAPVTSCPCVLLPTPAPGAPTSLQSHPLCIAVVAQGKGGEPKCGWWGPGRALHCCRCEGAGVGDGSMGGRVVHALLPLIYHSWQNGHSRHAGGANTLINGAGKKQAAAPPAPSPCISSTFHLPED